MPLAPAASRSQARDASLRRAGDHQTLHRQTILRLQSGSVSLIGTDALAYRSLLGGAVRGSCEQELRGIRKDRDIGYAPAVNSCERVNNVDTCTVAVLDAIAAFAVPNPGVSSQIRRFFRVWPSSGSPRFPNHSAYFGLATILEANPFSRRRPHTSPFRKFVNARFLCNS